MKNKSVFDIIGPVMVGPSSSHTAGAASIGKVARTLLEKSRPASKYRYTVPLQKPIKGMLLMLP